MSKETRIDKQGLVPKLRFPEFRDAGAWKKIRLGQLGELVTGLTYHPNDIRDKGLLVLRSSNIQNGVISLEDKVYVRTDIKGANISKPNDILICVRNGSKSLIGKNALIPERMPPSTHGAFMTVFRTSSAKFAFQLFQTFAYKRNVAADLGATINSINGNQFKKYEFFVPKLEQEQQKIADCLSSIDDLITAQTQKIDTLKAHKKGLMQQLFPAQGETIPKLRFPEFRDAGDWEEKRLGQVVKFLDGQRKPIKESNRASMQGQYPYYGASGIIDYINDFIFDETLILLGEDGENIVSRNLPLVFKISGKCWVNNHAHVLKPIKQNYLDFLVQYLESLSYVKYNSGGAQPKLNQAVCKTIPLQLPNLSEQQKIADCLTSIDNLITAQRQKLDILKAHKKGLMQQLFPAIDEANR